MLSFAHHPTRLPGDDEVRCAHGVSLTPSGRAHYGLLNHSEAERHFAYFHGFAVTNKPACYKHLCMFPPPPLRSGKNRSFKFDQSLIYLFFFFFSRLADCCKFISEKKICQSVFQSSWAILHPDNTGQAGSMALPALNLAADLCCCSWRAYSGACFVALAASLSLIRVLRPSTENPT